MTGTWVKIADELPPEGEIITMNMRINPFAKVIRNKNDYYLCTNPPTLIPAEHMPDAWLKMNISKGWRCADCGAERANCSCSKFPPNKNPDA